MVPQVMSSTPRNRDSWHRPLLLLAISANPGSPPHPVNGHTVERSRVDTHGGEQLSALHFVLYTLFSPRCELAIYTSKLCFFRGMSAILLCNDTCTAFFSVSVPAFLSAVYYFLLRSVLCRRFFFTFFSSYPALNDCPHEVCFQLFFLCVTSLRLLVLYYPPSSPESVFARAFFSPLIFSSRVAVSPGLDISPVSIPPFSPGVSPRLALINDESETLCNTNRHRTSA